MSGRDKSGGLPRAASAEASIMAAGHDGKCLKMLFQADSALADRAAYRENSPWFHGRHPGAMNLINRVIKGVTL
ncbi:hypothetical protein [Pseudomonas sp. PH1b]|uniref:hypothetical protein n=1 Tax=Pseudomonas sp. PH1b TaxID=1397282 RepID=UPI00046ADEC4|nr:hypothetical protein [Pseudomonas sp. PH1b]